MKVKTVLIIGLFLFITCLFFFFPRETISIEVLQPIKQAPIMIP